MIYIIYLTNFCVLTKQEYEPFSQRPKIDDIFYSTEQYASYEYIILYFGNL